MTNYILSEKDRNTISRQNARNGWGFSKSMLLYQLRKYKAAYQSGDLRTMAMVEERLTDANFHHECNFLHQKDFDSFVKAISE